MALRRIKRQLALLLIGLMVFAYGSIALAACAMDRAAMAHSMAAPLGEACDGCPAGDSTPVSAVCVAHCTADLQLAALAYPIVRSPSDAPLLLLLPIHEYRIGRIACQAPPPNAVPTRILLHSFLI